jgi:dihydroorotase
MVDLQPPRHTSTLRIPQVSNSVAAIETSPQCLIFTEADYARFRPRPKASPPLRSAEDVVALRQALRDGTIDIVVTDHAPMPSVQTWLAAMLHLVDQGVIGLTDLVRLCASKPAERFGLGGRKGSLRRGADADIIVLDPSRPMKISNADQLSKAGYTVFDGLQVSASIESVFLRGIELVRQSNLTGRAIGRVVSASD